MEFRKIKNKQGQVLTTEEGIELQELRLEIGDEIIPLYNNIMEKTNEVEFEEKGKKVKRKITNYSIKCLARDKNKQTIKQNGKEELFVTLTPAQAESLKKKIKDGIELNQHIFVVYKYDSKDFGEQIGIGLKKANKPAKSFQDFEKE